jgi:hypothetical protein
MNFFFLFSFFITSTSAVDAGGLPPPPEPVEMEVLMLLEHLLRVSCVEWMMLLNLKKEKKRMD